MSYHECDENLLPLPCINDNEQESDSSAESDQLEIVSDAEDSENLLVRLNNYLNLDSADDTGLSSDEDHKQNIKKFIDEDEHEKDDDSDNPIVSNITSSITPHGNPIANIVHSQQSSSKTIGEFGSSKRKRRQWSIKEKLFALNVLGKNVGNKQLTAHQYKKCKRLSGGGSKIKYIDLDHQLVLWFREKRTFINPQSIVTTGTTTTTTIRREKVAFRQLQRQGRFLSIELQHAYASTKWFARFMRRHRLSLQKPKRHKKIPLSDVYPLVNRFYDHIRRASLWTPSCGPMGEFLSEGSTKLGPTSISLGEIEQWCLESSQSIPESDDTPFVASYQIIYDDVLIVGTTDLDRHFHLFSMAICSNEATQDFRFIFRALQDGLHKLNFEEINPDFLITDSADAIRNAFQDVFGEKPVVMC
ncbi:unnamed protein product [Rotaria sp. Silwood2]|nr:unnamed protein product [Rotaria sp. Silwood2]